MRLSLRDRLLIACLSLSSACAMAAPAPDEDACRKMVQHGVDVLRSPSPGNRPRDEADRQRLLAEMERLVESNRRQGVKECEIWAQMVRKAVNQ